MGRRIGRAAGGGGLDSGGELLDGGDELRPGGRKRGRIQGGVVGDGAGG